MNSNVSTVSTLTRDEKIFLWNFMEELITKYQKAEKLHNSLFFAINNFESTRLPILSFNGRSVLEILYKFEQMTGLVKINNGTVAFTNKGLLEAQKSSHDWC
jgi:hypothetical protein